MIPRICVNPFLNEFLYNVLYHASISEKKEIPKRYAKKIKTSSAAQKFVNTSYIEEKLEVLTALGVGWTLVFYDKKKNKTKSITKIFESCTKDNQKDYIKLAMEQGVYLMTDRHMIMYQGLMADQTNHAIFSQSLLLSKAGYHTGKWRKTINSGETQTAKEHLDVAPYLAETILNTAIGLEYVEGTAGVTKNDFKILCYLYTVHHRYVSHEELLNRFSGNLSMSKVTSCMRRLATGFLIQKPADLKRKEYQITEIGIKIVTDFWRQILKANEIK